MPVCGAPFSYLLHNLMNQAFLLFMNLQTQIEIHVKLFITQQLLKRRKNAAQCI